MASISTITVTVDTRELENALRRIEAAYQTHAVWLAAPPPVPQGMGTAIAAGLMLAGSQTRTVTRRELLSFGFLKGKR